MKYGRVRKRKGQSLIEFAVVALVIYLLLAAVLTFGHMLYVAQTLQTAATFAAREIAHTSLPPVTTFEAELESGALDEIYQDDYLVYNLNDLGSQSFFNDVVPAWPLLNQQLAGLMIVDHPDFDGDGTADAHLLRYPGALLEDATTPTGYTVGIPLVVSRSPNGAETIRWIPVVEEIESADDPEPFSIESSQRGIVALRINYPHQSAVMSSFRPNAQGRFEPTIGTPNVADDALVTEENSSDRPGNLQPKPMRSGSLYAGTYGGTYGLGVQGALGKMVRPYRRIISAQAIFRREVFDQ